MSIHAPNIRYQKVQLFRRINTFVIKGYWFSITTRYYGKTCLFILLEIWINRWNNNYCKYCIAKKSHCCSFDYENMIFDSKEYLVYQLECRLSSIVVPYFTNNLIRFWSHTFIYTKINSIINIWKDCSIEKYIESGHILSIICFQTISLIDFNEISWIHPRCLHQHKNQLKY